MEGTALASTSAATPLASPRQVQLPAGSRATLCAVDGATTSELGRRLGVSKQAAAKTAAALVELGYSVAEAEQALASVDPDLPAEERVRLALRQAA